MPAPAPWAALKAADKHPVMKSADWVLFSDVDGFPDAGKNAVADGDHLRLEAEHGNAVAVVPQAHGIGLICSFARCAPPARLNSRKSAAGGAGVA